MRNPEDIENKSNDEENLRMGRERFNLAVEADAEIRKLALEDLEFSAGEQWPDDLKNARALDNRPCLTINRIPQFIRQITNDQRQNRPAIKVSPVDDYADPETAKVYQGIIRHIEYSSDADTAYDTAFDSAVRAGFGFFRVLTDYCDPLSFEQDIRIKRVRNRFTVYLDPNYQQPDGSDANWGFVFEDISIQDYKAQFPNSELASMDDWDSLGHKMPGWMSAKYARVAEYYFKEFEEKTILLVADNEGRKQVIEKDKVLDGQMLNVIAERQTMVPVVHHWKINGVEVLEKTIWPSKWIPIIPVLGEELDIDGKRVLEGIVRHAKDSQRMYNFWASSETETIALAPRAPWVGYAGQFEGFEADWETANTRNHAYLQVNPTMINGQAAPLPQRNAFEPPVQAISNARMLASEDLKATTGIYDAALGAKSNEYSGIAIQRRKIQSQTSNFHFIDNLSKSIRHAGRILVDLIPKIYDTDRAVRILGEDGTEEVIKINQVFERKGETVRYDLGVGKYDVTVDTGPSFETKRQEAVQAMLDFTKAMPQQSAVIADLLVKNMDWPGAHEIAERLKKTLPPGIADDPDKKPLPPEVQAQMAQMNQMIEQLTERLNDANSTIEMKTLELESRERIEMAKLRTQIEIKLAEMGSSEAQFVMAQDIANIKQRLEMLKMSEPIEPELQTQNQNQEFLGAGPNEAMAPIEQPQPTGGQQTPGLYME